MPMPSDHAEVMVGQWTLPTYSYILRQAWDDAPRPKQAPNSTGDQSGVRLTLLNCGECQHLSGAHAVDCSRGLPRHHPKSCQTVDASHRAGVAVGDVENTSCSAIGHSEMVSAASVQQRSSDLLMARAPLDVPHGESELLGLLNCDLSDRLATGNYQVLSCTDAEVAAAERAAPLKNAGFAISGISMLFSGPPIVEECKRPSLAWTVASPPSSPARWRNCAK